MNTIRRISQLLMISAGFLMLAACAQGAMPDARTTAAAQEDITQVHNAFLKAFNAKDPAGIAAVYTDDAMLMPPNEPGVKTQVGIETFVRGMFTSSPVTGILLNVTETEVTNGFAYCSGYYTMLGPNGSTMDRGKFLQVLKQTDKGWKIHRDMFSSDMAVPSATPAPATATAPAATTH